MPSSYEEGTVEERGVSTSHDDIHCTTTTLQIPNAAMEKSSTSPPPSSLEKRIEATISRYVATALSLFSSLSNTSRDSAFLFSLFFGMKGICWSILWLSQLPYYKSLGVSGSRYQMLFLLSISSLSMKGLAGVLSDCFPILGYHKRPYLIGALVCVFCGFAAIQGLPLSIAMTYPELSAFCLFIAGLGIATADLLSETSCAERVAADRPEFAITDVDADAPQELPRLPSEELRSPMALPPPALSLSGTEQLARASSTPPSPPPKDTNRLISFAWLGVTIGWLMSALFCGPTVDATGDARWAFRTACIIPLILLVPAVKGALKEPRALIPQGWKKRPWIQMQRKTITSNKGTLGLAITIPILTAVISLAGVLLPPSSTLVLTWTSAVVLIIFAYKVLPWTLASANVYILLSEALYVSLQGATDFYFTSPENSPCVKDGPHFSYSWYQGISSIVSTGGCFVALIVFDKVVRHWQIRRAFWVTTVLKVCATVFDVMLVLRVNISIGIPDKVFFLFGDAMLPSLCWLLDYLPGLLLASRLCLKETAATSLAILEAFRFFGTAMSRTSGVFVIDVAGIATKGPDCDFSALPWAMIACHTVLPLLTIPLTFWLLPGGYFADVGVAKVEEECGMEGETDTTDAIAIEDVEELPSIDDATCVHPPLTISPDAPTTLPVSPHRQDERSP